MFELAVLKQGAVIDQRLEVHGAHSKKENKTVTVRVSRSVRLLKSDTSEAEVWCHYGE